MPHQNEVRNLQIQEIEMITNMYCNEIKEITGLSEYKKAPNQYNDMFQIILVFKDTIKYELQIQLPQNYPLANMDPRISIRSNELSQTSTSQLYRELKEHFEELLQTNDFKIVPIIEWVQTNILKFSKTDGSKSNNNQCQTNETKCKTTYQARFWIYSHHIYSSVKRKNMLTEAKNLGLSGFVLPGKPGIICLEGKRESCEQFWTLIKKWNWKKIVLKHEEHLDISIDNLVSKNFLKFGSSFSELNLNDTDVLVTNNNNKNIVNKGSTAKKYDEDKDNNGTKDLEHIHLTLGGKFNNATNKHNHYHADMGKFAHYLRIHNCEHIIPIIFNLS